MGRFKNDELMRLQLEFVLNAPPRLNEALGIGLFEGQTTLSKKRYEFLGMQPTNGRLMALVRNLPRQRVDGIFPGNAYAAEGFCITALNERV